MNKKGVCIGVVVLLILAVFATFFFYYDVALKQTIPDKDYVLEKTLVIDGTINDYGNGMIYAYTDEYDNGIYVLKTGSSMYMQYFDVNMWYGNMSLYRSISVTVTRDNPVELYFYSDSEHYSISQKMSDGYFTLAEGKVPPFQYYYARPKPTVIDIPDGRIDAIIYVE